MTEMDLKHHLRSLSEDLGFDAFGVASPFVAAHLDAYREMVSTESYGDMGYLARHLPLKEDPNLLLPGVKSAIVVAKNYKNTPEKQLSGDRKVARYAAGQDYHLILTERVNELAMALQSMVPDSSFYVGVDSRPLPERTLAILAGIGFKARNSMIIRPKLGSYFLLGVILTTIDLPLDQPLKGGCGTCQKCVDACPTQAIGMDGSFKYTECISYQTIEKKTPLPPSTLATFNGWIFGCDICQEVCPFNHDRIPLTTWPELTPAYGVGHHLTKDTVLDKETALYRSRKRVMGNLENSEGATYPGTFFFC